MKKVSFIKVVQVMVLVVLLAIVAFGFYFYFFSTRAYYELNEFLDVKYTRVGKGYLYHKPTGKKLDLKFDDFISLRESDTAIIYAFKGKRGYLNAFTGKQIVGPIYERAWIFSEGLAGVVKDGKLGFINGKGETVLPFKYKFLPQKPKFVDFVFHNGTCVYLDEQNRCGLINKQGDVVLPAQYEYIHPPFRQFRIVVKDQQYGVIDSAFNTIIPVEYDHIGFSDNGVLMQKNKRLWLLDFDFKTIINPQVWHNAYALDYPSGKYDKLHNDIMLKTDLIVVSVDYKRGLIDKTGKVIVEPIYDDIEGLNANVVACELDDNVVLFKLDGTPLINNNTVKK